MKFRIFFGALIISFFVAVSGCGEAEKKEQGQRTLAKVNGVADCCR